MKTWFGAVGWLVLAALLTGLAHADSGLLLRSGAERFEDYPALRYFCQPMAQAPRGEALLGHLEQWPWQAAGAEVPNHGLTRDTCWFRLRIQNLDHPADDWRLVIHQPLLQELDAYVLDAGGRTVASYQVGVNRPFANRPYPAQDFVFPLRLPPGGAPLQVLLRVRTNDLQLPLQVVEARRYADDVQNWNLLQGLFFGGMLIMVLYNLFLYVSIRERAYLYYVGWSAMVTLIQADLQGLASRFLWQGVAYIIPGLMATGVIFGSLFALNFLGLTGRRGREAALLRGLAAAGALALLLSALVEQYYSLNICVLLFLTMNLSSFGISLRRALRGDTAARYLSVAWFCFITGSVSIGLDKLGLLPRNLLTENLAQAGSFIEVALLSLALADRINQLKAARSRAELTAMAASARSQASNEFLATMSHKIRTPMNGVLGLTDLLRHTELSPQQLQYVNTIQASSHSLLGIINDILDYSRIQAGQLRLELIPVPVEQLLHESVALFAARALEKNLPLLTFIGGEVPAIIESDPARLRQVINNLLSNALKFTERGMVRLSVSAQERAGDDRLLLEFAVEDTGIGIAPEQQQRLFHAFSQADSSTTRRYGGSGLGLSICKQLCELLGGEIGMDSAPEQGSRFWFRIPARVMEARARITTLENRRLLIVSSDSALCASLSLLGERWGMAVAVAEHFAAARELLDGHTAEGAVVLGPEMISVLPHFRDRAAALLLLQEPGQQLPAGNYFVREELPIRICHLQASLLEGLGRLPAGASPALTAPDRLALRVLVAEDNAINQMVITGILKSVGLTPGVVENGAQAVREAARDWDVIIMDCEMPEMDGYEATRRIRAQNREQDRWTWIIALSAHAAPEYVQKAKLAGVDDYLSKPVSRQQVLEALRRGQQAMAAASGRGGTAPGGLLDGP